MNLTPFLRRFFIVNEATLFNYMQTLDKSYLIYLSLYLGGKVINSPSTLSHEDRYLPNAWVVTANPKQKIRMTIDGKK